MRRSVFREWMFLVSYLFVLILLTVHSGYLCKKLWFVLKQCVPVIVALILAFVLNHPYRYVYNFYKQKGKMSKKAAHIGSLITTYLGFAGIIAAAGYYALPRLLDGIAQFTKNRDGYVRVFEESFFKLTGKLGISQWDPTPLFEGIYGYLGRIDEILDELLPQMARLTTGLFRGVTKTGIILVLSFYMLYDQEHLLHQFRRLYYAYIPKQYDVPVRRTFQIIREIFDNFIVGQGLESLILGCLCFAGMFFLRLEYSGFVSLVVGVTAFIPFFGAYIGGGLGCLLLLFVSIRKALIFFVFFVVLQQVENNLIYPRIVGRRTGLPALWVLVSVSVGGGVFGIVGMILGVPFATLIYALLKRNVEIRECKKAAEDKIDIKIEN